MPVPRSLTRLACIAAVVAGCRNDRSTSVPPAEFLFAAGDSTFWVRAGEGGIRVRRSSILLTHYDGRFFEVYVADDDRSYYDAVFVGQRIFRRDLVSGDSAAVFDDPTVPSIAKAYAVAHPSEQPLAPHEEGSESPHAVATSETEILDVYGPLLTFEHHTDVDIVNGQDSHTTLRGVVDLRNGSRVTVASILGEREAARVVAEGRLAFAAALDSVRFARDPRARRATQAMDGFTFDSSSFTLTDADGVPAVAFLVPGRGDRAGGLSLPLRPIPTPAARWWTEVRGALPTPVNDSDSEEWRGPRYNIVARYDTTGDTVTLAIRGGRQDWKVGHFPSPARRVYRLDSSSVDSVSRRALARAFDESVLYSDQARTASLNGTRRGAARLASDPRRSVGDRRAKDAAAPGVLRFALKNREPRTTRPAIRN